MSFMEAAETEETPSECSGFSDERRALSVFLAPSRWRLSFEERHALAAAPEPGQEALRGPWRPGAGHVGLRGPGLVAVATDPGGAAPRGAPEPLGEALGAKAPGGSDLRSGRPRLGWQA